MFVVAHATSFVLLILFCLQRDDEGETTTKKACLAAVNTPSTSGDNEATMAAAESTTGNGNGNGAKAEDITE